MKRHKGSATVAVVSITERGMETSVVGDSGYALYHVESGGKLKLYFRSKE